MDEVRVPREPTEAMLKAAERELGVWHSCGNCAHTWRTGLHAEEAALAYRAMIAAAPQPAHIPVTAEEEASIDLALGMHALPTIRLPLDAYKRLADEAAARSVTLSAFVRWLLSTPQPEPASAEPVAYMVTKRVDVGVGVDREVVLSWEPGLPAEPSEPLYTRRPIDAAEVLRLADEYAAQFRAATDGNGSSVTTARAALCRALGVKA